MRDAGLAGPRLAAAYGDDATEASKSALAELATALKSYRDALVLIGGWAPYLILERFGKRESEFQHVGSIDIDWVVDPQLVDRERYATIIELLRLRGYTPIEGSTFQFEREISRPDGVDYTVRVDFLTPEPLPGQGRRRRHRPLQIGLKARTLPGAEVALAHNFLHQLQATLPGDGVVSVELRVADVVGALALKGVALGQRYVEKDAYDIYALCAHYQDGPRSVAQALLPYASEGPVAGGLRAIAEQFRDVNAPGPNWVAAFLGRSDDARIKQDAYMTVSEILRLLKPSA